MNTWSHWWLKYTWTLIATLSSDVEDDAELTTCISSAERWNKTNSLEKEDNELFWNTL